MDILVCIKNVPYMMESGIEIDSSGNDIIRAGLPYAVNEWDNYAVEEAIQIKEKGGGTVTVVSVGSEKDDEALRREMAMGADKGILISDPAFQKSDGKGIATVLKAEVDKANYDLVLTGVQADDGAAQVGGMLAAMLGWPYASIVNYLEVLDGKKIEIRREIAGGNQEIYEVDLPCVLSIQTGINEPRYVSIRGVRRASSLEIPIRRASDFGISPDSVGETGVKVKRKSYFIPETGEGAEMLEGSTSEIIEKLIGLLKTNGGIR